jgi:hypothetical protein
VTATKFNLGDRVRDRLTRIEGVIIGYYFHLSGCQYVETVPDAKPDDTKSPDTNYGPEERYELVEAGDPETVKVPDISTCHVKLGDEVKDNLSGFKGHAIMLQIPLFGVGRVGVEPSLDKDGKLPDAIFFDEQRIEVIKPKAPPVAEAMPEERKKRGCAPSRVPARVLGR